MVAARRGTPLIADRQLNWQCSLYKDITWASLFNVNDRAGQSDKQ